MDQRDKIHEYHLQKNHMIYIDHGVQLEQWNKELYDRLDMLLGWEDKKCILSAGREISTKAPLSALARRQMDNIKPPILNTPNTKGHYLILPLASSIHRLSL